MEFEHKTESFKTGTSQSYSIFLPVGVNLRFSKKHPFFSKLNIFTEFRWLYNRVKIDGIAESFSNKFSVSSFEIQGGLGLIYSL